MRRNPCVTTCVLLSALVMFVPPSVGGEDTCLDATSTVTVCNATRDAADGTTDGRCFYTWDGVTYEALGVWCKIECDECIVSAGARFVGEGLCITYGEVSADPPAHTSTCLCRAKGLPASAETWGQAQSQDTYFDAFSVLQYVWPEPASATATVYDCGGGSLTAAFSSLTFTFEFGQSAVPTTEPPIRVTQFDAILEPVTVCGQNWGVSTVSMSADGVGFVDLTTGEITMPISFQTEMVNNVYGIVQPRPYLMTMVGSVNLLGDGVADVTINLVAEVCPGDFDRDADIDLSDLGILLSDYGCTEGPCAGDADGSGSTNLSDLGIVLSGYGLPCF